MNTSTTESNMEDAKLDEREYIALQSTTPPLTESTDNLSMNLSSNLSSSTPRDDNVSRPDESLAPKTEVYHNYEDALDKEPSERRKSSHSLSRSNHSSNASTAKTAPNQTQSSESSCDDQQASNSSNQSSYSSPRNPVRRRPRSGSGGSTKSSSFALDIIRRSRSNNNGSSSSYASALSDEMWINDWSHHSTGSQTSYLSASSIQSRRPQNPMLSRRSGSIGSSWASLEALDTQSLQSDRSRKNYGRKNANYENDAKQQKQQRINQHREDAVKNYHLTNEMKRTNAGKKVLSRSKSLPSDKFYMEENDTNPGSLQSNESNGGDQAHVQRKQREILNEDLDTTFHAGQYVPAASNSTVKQSMNAHRLPPTQYLDPRSGNPGPKYFNGQHISGIMERNTFDQNQFYNPRNGPGDASTKSAASNPYPMPAQGRPRVRQLSQPLTSEPFDGKQVNVSYHRNAPFHQNYYPYEVTINRSNTSSNYLQQYQNFKGETITIENEAEDRILNSHGIPRYHFDSYRRDDSSKMNYVYSDSRPDSFESFSGTYEHEQNFNPPSPNQYLYPNNALEIIQPINAPIQRQQMSEPRKQAEVPYMNVSKSKVSFSTVSIRHYNRILGDNPSCSNGPSLAIGWKYNLGVDNCPVDDYENNRFYARRYDHEMILSRSERESILIDLGYQQNDIARAVRANVKAKNRRRRTVHNLAFSKVEESIEVIRKKVSLAVRIGKKRREKGLNGRDSYGNADNNGSDSHRSRSSGSFTTQNSKGDYDNDSSEFYVQHSKAH